MKFGNIQVQEAEGSILAHSVKHGGGAFKKGRLLSSEDVAVLEANGVERIFAARLEADDVPEDEAAGAVARAVAGRAAEPQEPFTGRANLYASSAGVALIAADRVRALNRLHESLTVATVPPFEIVEARQMLGTVKVIPFAVPRHVLNQALALIGSEPLLSLAPFTARQAGLVITELPHSKPQLVAKTEAAMRTRLEAMGSRLGEVERVGHSIAQVGEAVRRLLVSGHDPVLIFGASAIVDRGDVVPQGVVAAGGEIVHLGMPVDPGNLLMLGRIGGVQVVGVPSCARSPKLNGFDWVLARILAGLDLKPQDVMDMGAGGLLTEIPTRPLPRERNRPQAPSAPLIAAIVLVAGRSSRMGGLNKLLEPVGARPMVRRVVEAALSSAAKPVIVVTGHEAEKLKPALAGLDVIFTHNPKYAEGMAGSLKAGLMALPPEADGVVVCLGDMPLIQPEHINKLIAAFNPAEGRAICLPVAGGRRGNPILWARRFIPEMLELTGDEGARRLVERHAEEVCEVPVSSEAIFADFDTPEAFVVAEAGGRL